MERMNNNTNLKKYEIELIKVLADKIEKGQLLDIIERRAVAETLKDYIRQREARSKGGQAKVKKGFAVSGKANNRKK